MNIYLSRSSVCAGDDVESHDTILHVLDDVMIIDALVFILKSGFIPSIAGGKSTWSVTSKEPLAVIAEQWTQPRLMPFMLGTELSTYADGDGVHLHLSYHAQEDPEVVHRILSGLRFP